jgi:hypothetical protein
MFPPSVPSNKFSHADSRHMAEIFFSLVCQKKEGGQMKDEALNT